MIKIMRFAPSILWGRFSRIGTLSSRVYGWDGYKYKRMSEGSMFEILLAVGAASSSPIITAGYTLFGGGGSSATTRSYTHVDDTVANGAALTTATASQGAASNGTVGLFVGGSTNGTIVDKFTLSSGTKSSGTASTGLFGSGYASCLTDYVNKYNLTNNTVTAGTNVGIAAQFVAALSSVPGGLS